MRRVLLIVLMSVIVFACSEHMIQHKRLGDAIIDWDTICQNGRQLLFTIEGNNATIYSRALGKYLRTGRVIRVYEVQQSDCIIAKTTPLQSLDDWLGQSSLNLIYENDMAIAKPWCITAGQADDDRHIELFVGAYRATQYFPAEVRPYFLEYRNRVIIREWTGSYLDCTGFHRAQYVDVNRDGYDELRVVEYHQHQARVSLNVAYYKLIGFVPYRMDIPKGEP